MVCLAEKHLAPVVLQNSYFGNLPQYVFYTTRISHMPLERALRNLMDGDFGRVKLINLDLDPDEPARMANFTKGKIVNVSGLVTDLASLEMPELDALGMLCLRRDLADIVHLPADQPR